MQHRLDDVLASGDVDALRRLLKHGDAIGSEQRQPPPPLATNLYTNAEHLVLTLSPLCAPLKIVRTRTMGKVIWPAGHAVALHLCETFADGVETRSSPAAPARVFLEVGAGSGVAALVAAAACRRAFDLVLATDFTETGELLLEENRVRNSSRMRCARLDVSEHTAMGELLDAETAAHEVSGSPLGVCVVACDMSYDADAIEHLFASAGTLVRHGGGRYHPCVWFARSSNFEHMDATSSAAAERHGFALTATHQVRAAGVQDALSATYLNPCVDDRTDVFVFERIGCHGLCAHTPGVSEGVPKQLE